MFGVRCSTSWANPPESDILQYHVDADPNRGTVSATGEAEFLFEETVNTFHKRGRFFYTNEDLEIAGSNHGAGDITTMGTHYTMGNNMIQLVYASGNMDTATTDYDTVSISNQMNLSKSTNITIGYTRNYD